MTAGDPIWYRQAQRGGYGYEFDVPGVFVGMSTRRMTIDVELRDGSWKRIAVNPEKIRRRFPPVRPAPIVTPTEIP